MGACGKKEKGLGCCWFGDCGAIRLLESFRLGVLDDDLGSLQCAEDKGEGEQMTNSPESTPMGEWHLNDTHGQMQ